MRVMIKAIFPVETANKAITDGSLGDTIGSILGDLKPEAAYFGLQEGARTAFVIERSQLPSYAEVLRDRAGLVDCDVEELQKELDHIRATTLH